MSATAFAPAEPTGPVTRRGLPVSALQNGVLWLLIFSGCVAFIEPSPFEIVFVFAAPAFLFTGARLPREAIPLLVLLMLFNVGGGLSLIEVTHDPKAIIFATISVYLAVVTLLFVMLMLDNTSGRVSVFQNAQIAAAVVATFTGALGYFDVAGLSRLFTQFGGTRASGMFKDPNVFGPFIVIAATLLFHGIVTGRMGRLWLTLPVFGFLCFGVLISFSRGAWGVLTLSLLLVVVLNLLTSRTWRARQRIAIVTILGAAGLVVVGMIALSVPNIANMVADRATLLKSYDSGETGRFGNQKRSIPMLLEEPNGFGPLQFDKKFTENPHNVYIFAFSSYGWMGGIAYFVLIVVTCVLGWRLVFQRTPWQHECIGLWCCLFPQILQGFQIDTDHWRHFWVLTGMIWGLAALSSRWVAAQKRGAMPA